MLALYVGGMGARGKNFYNDLACRYGFEGPAKEIQDLYLDGKKQEAAAAVPFELIDEVALLGPKERIADRLGAWREAGVTTMILGAQQPEALEVMAELVNRRADRDPLGHARFNVAGQRAMRPPSTSERDAVDVARVVGAQPHDRLRDLLGRGHAAHRQAAQHALAAVGQRVEVRPHRRGLGLAGQHRVDADALAPRTPARPAW